MQSLKFLTTPTAGSHARGSRPQTPKPRYKINLAAAHLLLLLALALLGSWPLLLHGLPDLSHDGIEQARFAKNFGLQFWSGEAYPRWLADENAGLGSATFFFYPPLDSYASALFWPVTRRWDPDGWLAAGYGCVLALLLSGMAAYFWLRSLADARSAFFGAALYLILPYHLAIQLYNRGAAAEFWIFVWFPLILLSAHGVSRRVRWAPLGLAFSYAGALLSHPITALCFTLVPVAYVLLFSERGQGTRSAAISIAAMSLGIGLAAVYLVPALLDRSKIHAEDLTTDFDYRNWWLFQRNALLNYKTRILALTLSTLAFVVTLFWLCRVSRPPDRVRHLSAFYLGVGMVSFFFMTQLSSVFWRLIPFLKLLSFPFRLNTILAVAAAAMSALAFTYFPRSRLVRSLGAFLVLGWIAADTSSALMAFSVWRSIPDEWATSIRNAVQSQQDSHYFWPQTVRIEEAAALPGFNKFISVNVPRSLSLRTLATVQGAGTASLVSWRPRQVVLRIDTAENALLSVTHFYYQGWRGSIGGTGREVPVVASYPNGFLQIEVPKGNYELVLDLRKDTAERLGIMISFGSLIVAIGVGIWTAASGVGSRK